MRKRILAILLATVMVVTLVTGCRKNPDDATSSDNIEIIYRYEEEDESTINEDGTSNESDTDNSSSDKTNSDKTNSDKTNSNKTNSDKTNSDKTNNNNNSDKNNEESVNLTGFPIVNKKETLTIMATTRADVGDPTNSQFTKTYEELTNIEIDWDLVPESQVGERRTLALQSGNMPDVFAVSLNDAEMNQYSAEGALVEITEAMLKKYAPNILATYNRYPETWDAVKLENGKMYSIATYASTYPYGQHFLWVRKTWLNNLGMAVPKTTDDFYNMLVAFRDGDPNRNNQKDEIPYATFSSSGFFFNSWGFGSLISVSNKGKVTHMYTTDNMTRCLQYWNKVYKEGLVDKNTINNYAGNNAAFKTLLAGGKVGAFYYGWPNEALDDKLLSEYEPIMWPTAGNNGDFPSVYVEVENIIKATGYTITKKCKNVPAALRFLDYLYTNDGYMLKMFGNEGGLYKKESNSKYVATGKAFTKQSDYGPNWTLPSVTFLTDAVYEQGTKALIWQKRDALNTQLESLSKSNGQKKLPNLIMNKSEIKSEKSYSPYFDEIKTEWYYYVKGDKNLNTDWVTLKNQMHNRNLDKYLAYQQAFYDRANKK